jgi:hypothetical protein
MSKLGQITELEKQLYKGNCNFEVRIAISEALECLNNIGEFYYFYFNYKEQYFGSNKGFISNQIKSIFPNAYMDLENDKWILK